VDLYAIKKYAGRARKRNYIDIISSICQVNPKKFTEGGGAEYRHGSFSDSSFTLRFNGVFSG